METAHGQRLDRRIALTTLAVVLVTLLPLARLLLTPIIHAQEKPMKHYVMFFRGTRSLTPAEQQQRAQEIRHWVARVMAMGIHLDPRNLADTVANLSQADGAIVDHDAPTDRALATMVFFDSPDKAEALQVARMHPSLHYGAMLELREWAAPLPPADKQ